MSRILLILLVIFSIFNFGAYTGQSRKKVVETFYKINCQQCHSIDKTTQIAPSIQHVTIDYGKKWAITFIKNTNQLVTRSDTNALYSIALFYPVKHVQFRGIDDEFALALLKYVDSFKYDSTQTRHRRVSLELKKKTVDSITAIHKLFK